MTLAELRALALAATPGPWILEPSDPDQPSRYVRTCGAMGDASPTSIRCLNLGDSSYIAALSPDVILRLLAVVEAAKAYRNPNTCLSLGEESTPI